MTLDLEAPRASSHERHVIHDLEDLPYPFDDDEFDDIHAYAILEHTGRQGDFRFFFKQFNEFHRILKPNGYLCAMVPLPDSVWAWADPGHTRIITRETLSFLTEEHYQQIGQTNSADYRSYIEGFWKGAGFYEQNELLVFMLQAQ